MTNPNKAELRNYAERALIAGPGGNGDPLPAVIVDASGILQLLDECDKAEADRDAALAELEALRQEKTDWQKECLKKGFEYVRESDDHYVVADPADMVSLLRDLLGIDVRQKDGSDYGVSVAELEEQIEGLINTIHGLEAFRKDAERLDRLDMECEAYGFEGIHEGNRWMIDGPFRTVRDAIDAAMSQEVGND